MAKKKKMTIDEQVAYLIQGADYGDDQVKKAMSDELKERLLEAEQEKHGSRSASGTHCPHA